MLDPEQTSDQIIMAHSNQPVDGISVTVEFTGGLDMLFSKKRKHSISLPAADENDRPSNIAYLVRYLCENLMTDCRKEFFVTNDNMFATQANIIDRRLTEH